MRDRQMRRRHRPPRRHRASTHEPAPVQITVARTGPHVVQVTVVGDVDMSTAPQLSSTVIATIDAHRPRSLTVDLAEVPFLDAAGMSALLEAFHHARGHDVDIRLTGVRPWIRRVLDIVDLLDVFGLR